MHALVIVLIPVLVGLLISIPSCVRHDRELKQQQAHNTQGNVTP
ncbi:hypothetical protein HYQ19_gp035 [Arthrobacter phage DrYang]|uniref:Uncharacterized protein n=1 Tax=Arthrobacter phage DrYang TaxID=2686080 RepID=A0A6B9J9U6_9CAUD|nr:hypothetical protein HYQ19_gp035 [Arthrobacter phage DrYang]QGZ17134.1 hypothetical protein SEA_DRYANG_35 [Arthrobacter phage DrYang]